MENVHHKNIRNKSKWLQMIIYYNYCSHLENKERGKDVEKMESIFYKPFFYYNVSDRMSGKKYGKYKK